jgi:hypothetical protein
LKIKQILLRIIRRIFLRIGPVNRSRIIQICIEFAGDQGPEYQFLTSLRIVQKKAIENYFTEHPEIVFWNHSYSQNGEDLVITRLLEKHPIGKYIDVGAYHPFKFSNTAKLNSLGWSGLNVDSNIESIRNFEVLRKSDDNVCIALGKSNEFRTYFQYEESALNTLSEDRALHLQNLGIHPNSLRTMEVVSAKEFLESKFTNDTFLFSLDVEGLDLDIIKELDYECFSPCFVIFEYEIQSLQEVSDLIGTIDFLNHYILKSVVLNSVILQSVQCDHAI